MLEKISTDFVGKIYSALTYGGGDINFLCSCLRMQNHEEATNKPVNFAMKLLKINIMCRLPFLRGRAFSKTLGEAYLSEAFLRPPVVELATGVLDNRRIITDIFGSAVVIMKSGAELFSALEKISGVRGFAALRARLDDPTKPIEDIYKVINDRLGCRVDFNDELELFKRYCIKNSYAARLLDIANGNGLRLTAYIRTSYPKDFISALLSGFGIFPDELLTTAYDTPPVLDEPDYTGIVSGNFKRFIKGYIKRGCQPFYYPEPRSLMEKIKKPRLSPPFAGIYDGLCGLRIFSGAKQQSFEYELAYLCLAPAIFGFALSASRAAGKRRVICVCGEYSLFAEVLKKLLPDASFDPSFIPSSAGADDFVIYPFGGNDLAQADICSYLGIAPKNTEMLFRILRGARGGAGDKALDISAMKEIYSAVFDFADDFISYLGQSGEDLNIDGSDCLALYRCGESGLKRALGL